MRYQIEWIENKTPEWKIASLTNEAGMKYLDVSINKKDKNNLEFPNFDNLKAGDSIYGEYWEKPDGSKKYLYPPRQEKTQGGAPRGFGGGIGKQMMEQKKEDIKESQGRKDHSIKESGSMRDSVQLALAEFHVYEGEENLRPTLDFLVKKWRKFLLDNWSLPF